MEDSIREWHKYFLSSGEIPVPEIFDNNNYDWIEDNWGLIANWISETFIPEFAKEQFRILEITLLNINRHLYQDVSQCISDILEDKKKERILKYARNYRQANKEIIKEKRARYYMNNKEKLLRKKILDNLNQGITLKPRESTLQKYNIQFVN
jgi:hypothetical protein